MTRKNFHIVSLNPALYHVVSMTNLHLTFPSLEKGASKPFPKCQSEMLVKIRVIVTSSNSSIEMTCRWRVKRPVMSLRPPPGGPIAPTNNYNT